MDIIGKQLTYDPRNLIINGDMDFNQRANGATGMTVNQYTIDRWKFETSGQGGPLWVTDLGAQPPVPQSGYQSGQALRFTSLATFTPGSTDFMCVTQYIEGYNIAEIAQQEVCLSFWMRATFTGTGCVSFANAAADHSYVAEYTILAANSWQLVTIRLKVDTTQGTWNFKNGIGLRVSFALSAGSSMQTTPGAWQSGNFYGTSNQFNFGSSGSNLIYFSQVMLKRGAGQTPFERAGITIDREYEMCQRYFESTYEVGTFPGTATMTGCSLGLTTPAFGDLGGFPIPSCGAEKFKVAKRAVPTITSYSTNTGAANAYFDGTNATDHANNVLEASTKGFVNGMISGQTANAEVYYHWTADSDF